MIVRPELYDVFTKSDLQLPSDRPMCLVLGGSLGAMKINEAVWNGLKDLTDRYTAVSYTHLDVYKRQYLLIMKKAVISQI